MYSEARGWWIFRRYLLRDRVSGQVLAVTRHPGLAWRALAAIAGRQRAAAAEQDRLWAGRAEYRPRTASIRRGYPRARR